MRGLLTHVLRPLPDITLDGGTKLVTLTGTGFSHESRILFAGESLKPISMTPTQLVFKIDPKKNAPPAKPAAEYSLVITDGPKRIALVSGRIKVEGPTTKKVASVSMTTSTSIMPGEFVGLKFTDPNANPKATPPVPGIVLPTSAADIEIWAGSQRINTAQIILLGKGKFGFIAPTLPDDSSRQLPVLVRFSGKEYLADKQLFYASHKSGNKSTFDVRIVP